MSDLDWRLFKFFGDHMRSTGRTATLGQIRLHLRLKTKQQAKDALANLITYLAHREVCSLSSTARLGG
jgi:hypothetical protein